MTSIKIVMAVSVQEGLPLYHFDVTQALERAAMDTNVFMKLQAGCGPLMGTTVGLERVIEGAGMTQSKAGSCVYKQEERGSVHVILVVHVWTAFRSGERRRG